MKQLKTKGKTPSADEIMAICDYDLSTKISLSEMKQCITEHSPNAENAAKINA